MNRYTANIGTINAFLKELNTLLSSKEFDFRKDFILAMGKDHKNFNTLENLGFTTQDVINELKKLSIKDYNHSVPDDKNQSMPDFHIFFPIINNQEIYIKIRIQNNKIVFCISFHYPDFTSHKANPYI